MTKSLEMLCLVALVLAQRSMGAEKNELLVKWQHGPNSAAALAGNAAIGSSVSRTFSEIGWQVVRLPEGMSTIAGLAKYRSQPEILAVEANGRIESIVQRISSEEEPSLNAMASGGPITPNDPRWSGQWNLRKIGMPAAWGVTTGSTDVVVAVIDSGVDYKHEDLQDNMWHNPGETGPDATGKDKASNGVDDDNNGYIDDVHGIDLAAGDSDPMDERGNSLVYHGTACASVLGAAGNNRKGMAGVAWAVRIMALRYSHVTLGSKPLHATIGNLVEAYNYVIAQRRRGVNVRIANNSYSFIVPSLALEEAIAIAGREGILSVCIGGNQSVSTDGQWQLPAQYDQPYIIATAATDQNDRLATFSNFGLSTLDLAAPGLGIHGASTNTSYYSDLFGTSFAGPHVAGAAVLLWAVRPEAAPLEIKAALLQSVDKVASLQGKVATGGRLNVARALQVLTNASLPCIIVGAFPGSSRTSPNAPVEIWFSEPMDRSSVENALHFEPPISGSIEWTEGDRMLRLRPTSPLLRTNYQARVAGTAQTLRGATLDGNFDRKAAGSPADDFVWGFSFAPEHDDMAGARLLSGREGIVHDNTTNSTIELHEPWTEDPDRREIGGFPWGPSLWYEWTAQESGWMTFDTTAPEGIDTVVACYEKTATESLLKIVHNDDHGDLRGGRVSIPVRSSASYLIAVAGKNTSLREALGPFTLSWYPTPAPGFTVNQFSPRSAMPGAKVTLTGTNFTGATEVLFNGAIAEFTLGLTSQADHQISATVPPDTTDGPITVSTPHGAVTSAANFAILPPPLRVTLSGTGDPELSWPAHTPAIALEGTDNFNSGVWTKISTALLSTNGGTIHRPDEELGKKFYRLKKQ